MKTRSRGSPMWRSAWPPHHDAPEGGVGGPEARSNSGRPPHCEVRRAGQLGGRVPRPVGSAEHAALDRPPPHGGHEGAHATVLVVVGRLLHLRRLGRRPHMLCSRPLRPLALGCYAHRPDRHAKAGQPPAACRAEYGRGGWGDAHADYGLPAAREGRDAAAAAACPPAVGGERQAVIARGERASHPYGGQGGHGEAGGVGRGGVLGLCSGGSKGTGMGCCYREPAEEAEEAAV